MNEPDAPPAWAFEPVHVVAPDPNWPAAAERHIAEVHDLLGDWLTSSAVHVGSTAIPGLTAKPIIDLQAIASGTEGRRRSARRACRRFVVLGSPRAQPAAVALVRRSRRRLRPAPARSPAPHAGRRTSLAAAARLSRPAPGLTRARLPSTPSSKLRRHRAPAGPGGIHPRQARLRPTCPRPTAALTSWHHGSGG